MVKVSVTNTAVPTKVSQLAPGDLFSKDTLPGLVYLVVYNRKLSDGNTFVRLNGGPDDWESPRICLPSGDDDYGIQYLGRLEVTQ